MTFSIISIISASTLTFSSFSLYFFSLLSFQNISFSWLIDFDDFLRFLLFGSRHFSDAFFQASADYFVFFLSPLFFDAILCRRYFFRYFSSSGCFSEVASLRGFSLFLEIIFDAWCFHISITLLRWLIIFFFFRYDWYFLWCHWLISPFPRRRGVVPIT